MTAERPALRRGQHPTQADLDRMRLGYPGYQGRLDSMRRLKPARYEAVLTGARTFADADWRCAECGGSERYTRNLACRGCAVRRPERVFKPVPGVGTVYIPTDEAASENWQQRHLRAQRLQDQAHTLSRLGSIAVGRYTLAGGRVLRTGCVVLDTEPLMLAVDALLSGDPAQARAAMAPLLQQDRDLAVCVRTVAQAVSNLKLNKH